MKQELLEELKRNLASFKTDLNVEEAGVVIDAKDGVTRIVGLSQAKMGELVKIKSTIPAMVLSLESGSLLAVILADIEKVSEGDKVYSTGQLTSVGVGSGYIGRVVDALGEPIDGLGAINIESQSSIEAKAPGVIERQSVNVPLQTGILSIDALVPVGRGQRELIIGDKFTGKTAIAVDTIINQKGKDVICIYVAIGQKQSKTAQLVGHLRDHGAMEHTIVVSASAGDSVSSQMIAPFTGATIAEYFMKKGQDVLIVYDDLTKHAWAYRQISLGLKRPPGREAYPGDIFYLHSRLLERSARLSEQLGGGSITALPIIETQGGDVSAYIPTNVISITDGQIYLDKDSFNSGARPALDAGLSVSRVGGAAQIKAMKQMAGQLRLDLAQYRDLVGFAQFGSDLDVETKNKIQRGRVTLEILKQDQFATKSVIEEVLTLYLCNGGYLDELPSESIRGTCASFVKHTSTNRPDIILEIEREKSLTDSVKITLDEICKQFFQEVTNG